MNRSFIGFMVFGFGASLAACSGAGGETANTAQSGWAITDDGLRVFDCTAVSEFEITSEEEAIQFIAVEAGEWSGEDLRLELLTRDEQNHERLLTSRTINASTLQSESSSDLVVTERSNNSESNASRQSTENHSEDTLVDRSEVRNESESIDSESIRETEDERDWGSSFASDFDRIRSDRDLSIVNREIEETHHDSSDSSSSDQHMDSSDFEASRESRESAFTALETLASTDLQEMSLDRTEVFLTENEQNNRFIVRVSFSGSVDMSRIHVAAGDRRDVRVHQSFDRSFNACDL
jgi:hypothetical protein